MKNKLKENYHRKSIRQYYHDNVNSPQTKPSLRVISLRPLDSKSNFDGTSMDKTVDTMDCNPSETRDVQGLPTQQRVDSFNDNDSPPESHYQHWLKTALGRAYLEARR